MWSDRYSSFMSSSHSHPTSAQSREPPLPSRSQNSQSVNEVSPPSQSPAASKHDSLDVVNLILGRGANAIITDGPISNANTDDDSPMRKPDELVEEIDFGDMSLEDFVKRETNVKEKASIGASCYGFNTQGTKQCPSFLFLDWSADARIYRSD